MAYGYIHAEPVLYIVAAVLSVLLFLLEAGYNKSKTITFKNPSRSSAPLTICS